MLFNSFEFLLLFLPITLLVYRRIPSRRAALAWLSLASLVFYGYWNPLYLPLLIGSILANYAVGRSIQGAKSHRQLITALGVSLNLGLLGYFKYANFFVSEIASLTQTPWSIDTIILPLAISFFTFQQIAYLVDTLHGRVTNHDLLEYSAFVIFFPQLIAGPIVHQRDILPQFKKLEALRKLPDNLSAGFTIFVLGLFKKVAIADELARFANPAFDAAAAGVPLTFIESWTGALAYTGQLYFDFSGYSDMAIGLGVMFGLSLPVNFASPYKARSIIEFWRSWHITLSAFLRDYLYVPLGGNRLGQFTRYRNLLITMILGGLWHGAGWTFVFWGTLHGLYLAVNHLWRAAPLHSRIAGVRGYGTASWILTILCVIVGWVFFRAMTFDSALNILRGMAGMHGISFPPALATVLQPLFGAAARFDGFLPSLAIPWASAFSMILAAGILAAAAPNVFEMFHKRLSTEFNRNVPFRSTRITWRSSPAWSVLTGILLAYCLLSLSQPSEFLYFQF